MYNNQYFHIFYYYIDLDLSVSRFLGTYLYVRLLGRGLETSVS
jgi:hypothetical protein